MSTGKLKCGFRG